MKIDTNYFSHDFNARNDTKIKKLIHKKGMQGYGLWWALVEDLYNNDNRLELDFELIAHDLRTDEELVESIINDFDLFKIEGDYFMSNSVEERIEKMKGKSKIARENANNRWNKSTNDATAMQPHSNGNATAMQTECYKQTDIHTNINTDIETDKDVSNYNRGEVVPPSIFSPPSMKDVSDFFIENGYQLSIASEAYRYYQDRAWFDSKGNEVRDWKQKMHKVLFKPENKAKVLDHYFPQMTN